MVYTSVQLQALDFIRNPDPGSFEALGLSVFAHQFEKIEPYRRFCRILGLSPDNVRSIAEIPPVSTAAFKYIAFCAGEPERVFLTSGTTRGRGERGRHPITDLKFYHASAVRHLQRMLFADGCRPWMLALHPTADRMPESSLSQMISWCIESFGGDQAICCATSQQVDAPGACDFLQAAQAAREPVCILATTAAISALFEYLRSSGAQLRLAAVSRLMDTGGAKGQSTPLEPGEVTAMARQYLGIAPALVINEYGMTELCSQLYDATPFNCPEASEGGDRFKIAPPWLKVIARDPASLRPLAPGETGLLSFFDLANADSVSALLTEDLGMVDGGGGVRIFGRAIGSDPRGCALGIEQFARSRHPHSVPAPVQGEGGADVARRAGLSLQMAPDWAAYERLPSRRIADALATACERWRDRRFPGRAATLDATAAATGQSRALLDASLDALLASFTHDSLIDLARRLDARGRLIGFIMPGNVIGAGLHELVQALIGGAALKVKASSAEPLFFTEFHRTLQEVDSAVAARVQAAVWDRFDRKSTAAMASVCDRLVAFGADDTMTALAAIAGPRLVAFGSRMSGAMLSREAIAAPHAQDLAAALARDVSLFDQRGCLSLHHILVEAQNARDGCAFAELMARAMAAAARSMPPPAALPLAEAAAARAARENARWRHLGDAPVALWEGGDLAWTVIFDPEASFQPSPLCRTVYVSTFNNEGALRGRLTAAAGALEGFAIADPMDRLGESRALLCELGVSYFCAPGQLQSPPPSWPHGGARFLRMMMDTVDG